MNAGPYARATVAEFLGIREEHVGRLIREDGLPTLSIPAKTRPAEKITLLGLHRWLHGRSRNAALTVDELELELHRAAERVAKRRQGKKARKEAKEAVGV